MPGDKIGRLLADVEVHEIKVEALDPMVDRAGDDVARRKLSPRIEIGHEATAIGRPLQNRTFAAHRLGDEDVLDLGVIETGGRSEENTSELQSLMRSSYAVCLSKKNNWLHSMNT